MLAKGQDTRKDPKERRPSSGAEARVPGRAVLVK